MKRSVARPPGTGRVKRATNLTLDPGAVASGERFGAQHGKSLSQLVNDFLAALPLQDRDDIDPAELTPPVRRLFGLASEGSTDREAYHDHLRRKYGSRRP